LVPRLPPVLLKDGDRIEIAGINTLANTVAPERS
jgi:hypothetical protein